MAWAVTCSYLQHHCLILCPVHYRKLIDDWLMVDIGLLSLILGFYVIFVHVFQMHVKEVMLFLQMVLQWVLNLRKFLPSISVSPPDRFKSVNTIFWSVVWFVFIVHMSSMSWNEQCTISGLIFIIVFPYFSPLVKVQPSYSSRGIVSITH